MLPKGEMEQQHEKSAPSPSLPRMSSAVNPTINNNKLRAMSVGRGKRAISSKSPHITMIPLDASFACSTEATRYYQQCHQAIPYLPYSASSKHSRVHQISSSQQHRQQRQQQQQTSLWKWKRGQSGYKSDSISCRAHSRKRSKSSSASILDNNPSAASIVNVDARESDTLQRAKKPVPYLAPCAINSSFPDQKNCAVCHKQPGDKSEGKVRSTNALFPLSLKPTFSVQLARNYFILPKGKAQKL